MKVRASTTYPIHTQLKVIKLDRLLATRVSSGGWLTDKNVFGVHSNAINDLWSQTIALIDRFSCFEASLVIPLSLPRRQRVLHLRAK